ncbi:hypothetical protein CCR94_11330 [Rhodoblastus sphagnicola]|uniref:Uncharacterized protein n=1 Tax=Rhodoblastus sphagnicola TaxID=333368 RepID=A0A2S6N870_9HYPH|nr:hypothetical protein [Rhodoblastus sphagnicola]MBB4201058.1 hypothetical protein [Rhodoblastus sphagnicola]PPQ30797.1 hypothetical protein CCR94_11330 [Rhodoblastus sphagnicola]
MAIARRKLTEVKRLANERDTTSIELAEALWQAEQTTPGTWAEIVSSTRLERRKAYALLQIWGRFAGLDVPRELLIDVGWTKATLVARLAEPGTELGWLDLANGITAKELEATLRGEERAQEKMHSVLFRLTPAQHALLTKVLLKHGATRPPKGKGLCGKEAALMKALAKASAR